MSSVGRRWWDRAANLPPIAATVLAVTAWAGLARVPPFIAAIPAPTSTSLIGALLATIAVIVMWLDDGSGSRVGLALVSTAWLATSLQGLVRADPVVAQLAAAAGPLALIGLAQSLSPAARRGVAAASVAAIVVHVLGYQPLFDPACLAPCPLVNAPLADRVGGRTALGIALLPELLGYVLLVVGAVRATIAILDRFAAIVVGVCFVVADAIPWWRWGEFEVTEAPDRLRALGVALATAAAGYAVIGVRRARQSLRGLIRQLGRGPGSDTDGAGAVQFAVPGSSRWIDPSGRETPGLDGPTLPAPDGSPAVRLITAESSPRAEALTPAALLALDNSRLEAVAKWRLAGLRESQARIVATSDRERHRIEMDLHDGAQQQLVGAAMHLAAARDRLDEGSAAVVDGVNSLIRQALQGLRTITHRGLLTVLTTEGLAAAIEDLAESSTGRVAIDIGTLPALPASVERAAYGVVELGLRSDAARAVRVRCDDAGLSVVVVLGGAPDDYSAAADRVGATGGEWTVTRERAEPDLVRLEATWPCG